MKLTMPSVDVGYAEIWVDGALVGRAMTVWDNRETYHGAWEAELWEMPGEQLYPVPPARRVRRLRLREVRAELRRRLDETGPWWAEEEADQ